MLHLLYSMLQKRRIYNPSITNITNCRCSRHPYTCLPRGWGVGWLNVQCDHLNFVSIWFHLCPGFVSAWGLVRNPGRARASIKHHAAGWICVKDRSSKSLWRSVGSGSFGVVRRSKHRGSYANTILTLARAAKMHCSLQLVEFTERLREGLCHQKCPQRSRWWAVPSGGSHAKAASFVHSQVMVVMPVNLYVDLRFCFCLAAFI